MRHEKLWTIEALFRFSDVRLESDRSLQSIGKRVLFLQHESVEARPKEERAVQRLEAEKLEEEERKKAERQIAEEDRGGAKGGTDKV